LNSVTDLMQNNIFIKKKRIIQLLNKA